MTRLAKFLFSLFILLFSCSSTTYKIVGSDLVNRYSKEFNSEGLQFYSIENSFCTPHPVNIYFRSFKKAGIAETRKILVDSIEKFLNHINNDFNIRPYLHHFPINYTDFIFYIIFIETDDNNVFPPSQFLAGAYVTHEGAFAKDGLVNYNKYNSVTDKLENIHTESYTRAKGIVEHQNNLINLPPQ